MSASVAERRIGRETVDNTSASLVNSVGISASSKGQGSYSVKQEQIYNILYNKA